ncbi:response regulator transcription factor [Microbacterium sp. HD4P20]|uniref:response regulator n=1 Tax=Microbacterium sp. HD4P20 TaxID=2864874 RepID=UPI001C643692|nr:response regulator transcription factor [Microbacterium sp. HD4P20]MCP2637179.1 response regulator transcription factor [Microbacterium sp. HD4P20]
MSVRVLLVDDDPLVIAGLRMLLAGDPGVQVVGEAADGSELVDAVVRNRPDVVLLDVRMPGTDGVSALRELCGSVREQPAVVMLTTFGAEPIVLDALRAGAAGFLLKHTPPDQIIAAIHAAAAGESRVSPIVLRQLIDHVARGERPMTEDPLEGLSDRERDVAMAVADGLANAEIGERLYLSVGSVKAHISSALAKLGLDNRVQLAIAAHEARSRGAR